MLNKTEIALKRDCNKAVSTRFHLGSLYQAIIYETIPQQAATTKPHIASTSLWYCDIIKNIKYTSRQRNKVSESYDVITIRSGEELLFLRNKSSTRTPIRYSSFLRHIILIID